MGVHNMGHRARTSRKKQEQRKQEQKKQKPETQDLRRVRAPFQFRSASCAFDGGQPNLPHGVTHEAGWFAFRTPCGKWIRNIYVAEVLHSKEARDLAESRGGLGHEKIMKIRVITFSTEEGNTNFTDTAVEFLVKFEVEGKPDSENAYLWVELYRREFKARLKFFIDVPPRHPSSTFTAREMSALIAALEGDEPVDFSPAFETKHLE